MMQQSNPNTNSYIKADLEWLRLTLKQKIFKFQGTANTHSQRRVAQYKYSHDEKVHFKAKFCTQLVGKCTPTFVN